MYFGLHDDDISMSQGRAKEPEEPSVSSQQTEFAWAYRFHSALQFLALSLPSAASSVSRAYLLIVNLRESESGNQHLEACTIGQEASPGAAEELVKN